MKSVPARNHQWSDADGKVLAEHRKSNDGRWGYRHRLAAGEFESGECAEHGKVTAGSAWCPKKPAALDGILWNMPALSKAIESGCDILWCAGEKDAERVQAVLDEAGSDAVATCVHQGENSPVTDGQAGLFEGFAGKVIIYFDRDVTGIKHALDRRDRLKPLGVRCLIKGIPGAPVAAEGDANDVSDYLSQEGASLADFRKFTVKALRAEMEKHAPVARLLKPRAAKADDAARAGRLKLFTDRLGKPATTAGDRNCWHCPLPGHSDAKPSFSVTVSDRGKVVLACSCPGGMARGDEHTQWVTEVLAALGLPWSAVTGSAGPEFPQTDHGNALLLARMHGDDLLYVQDGPAPGLRAWDGTRWSADDAAVDRYVLDVSQARLEAARDIKDDKRRIAAQGYALSCQNESRLGPMRKRAAFTVPRVPDSRLDAVPEVLPVGNGTIELLDSGLKFREGHRRDDYFSRIIPVAYRPGAQFGPWDDFLNRFLPDLPERDFLQKIMGYTLLGANKERLLVVITGPTSTGKTTFLNTILEILGPGFADTYQLSLFRVRRDDAPRPDILKVMPRRFIFAEEGSTEWKLHADTIKNLTSGGQIEARGMRSNDFTGRVPSFTPFIATNEYPTVQYADAALKRRLIGFPFSQPVSKAQEDGSFRARITGHEAGREAVLAWLCAGYEMYAAAGGIGVPPGNARIATDELRGSLSPLDQFISDCCKLRPEPDPGRTDKDFREPASDLYAVLEEWWRQQGQKPAEKPTQNAFGRHLTDAGYPISPTAEKRPGGSKKTTKYRYGIRLQTDWREVVGIQLAKTRDHDPGDGKYA